MSQQPFGCVEPPKHRLTVEQFFDWVSRQRTDQRFELVSGEMTETRIVADGALALDPPGPTLALNAITTVAALPETAR